MRKKGYNFSCLLCSTISNATLILNSAHMVYSMRQLFIDSFPEWTHIYHYLEGIIGLNYGLFIHMEYKADI